MKISSPSSASNRRPPSWTSRLDSSFEKDRRFLTSNAAQTGGKKDEMAWLFEACGVDIWPRAKCGMAGWTSNRLLSTSCGCCCFWCCCCRQLLSNSCCERRFFWSWRWRRCWNSSRRSSCSEMLSDSDSIFTTPRLTNGREYFVGLFIIIDVCLFCVSTLCGTAVERFCTNGVAAAAPVAVAASDNISLRCCS